MMRKTLALVLVAGCANAGTSTPSDDEDAALEVGSETGADAPTDAPRTDTGVSPTDTGVPPTDTGVPPTDTGVPPTDTGFDAPPPLPGVAFPFPQGRPSAWCTYPTYLASDVKAFYDTWKSKLVTASGAGGFRRVQRIEDGGDTVSEGIAYGMLAAVYMNDQDLFDDLFRYSQKYLDSHGFMHWKISPDGSSAWGTGGATDADEDIAWALVMASKQWGGSGKVGTPYLDLAKAQIDRIWTWEVDHTKGDVLKGGDQWTEDRTNPSYMAPSYYRVFGKITGKTSDWNKVVESSYKVLAASANPTTGLVPDWCSMAGSPYGDAYYYDAARTPFRVGLDLCHFGEPRAKALLDKLSAFFAKEGAAAIRDGYKISGAKTGTNESLVFTAPAVVGAMGGGAHKTFVNDGYGRVVALGKAPDFRYYAGSWGMLGMLAMSGNFLDYTAY